VEYIEERFGTNQKEINVLMTGDWHVGSSQFDDRIVDDALKEIETRPNGRIVLMGDLINAGIMHSVSNTYEETMTPHEQIDYVVNKLEPYKHKIVAAVGSNHSNRITKEVGINPTKMIMQRLGIGEKFQKWSVVIKWAFNKGTTDTFHIHGKTGSRYNRTIMKKVKDLRKIVDVDAYFHAHVHRLLVDDTDVVKTPDQRNMKINNKRYVYVTTGSSLAYDDSYAEASAMPAVLLGFPIMRITGDRGNQKIEIDKITL